MEVMWKAVVVGKFEVLSFHLPGETRKTTEDFNRDTWTAVYDLDLCLPRYETRMVSLRLHHSALIYIHLMNEVKLNNCAEFKLAYGHESGYR